MAWSPGSASRVREKPGHLPAPKLSSAGQSVAVAPRRRGEDQCPCPLRRSPCRRLLPAFCFDFPPDAVLTLGPATKQAPPLVRGIGIHFAENRFFQRVEFPRHFLE